MIERVFQIVLTVAAVWIAVGVVFGAVFHAFLVRVDPAVRGAGVFFRLLITPGIVALWPVLVPQLRRAAAGEPSYGSIDRPFSSRGLRTTHRLLVVVMSVVVPVALAAALTLRPVPVEERTDELAAVARVLAEHPGVFDPHTIDLTLLEYSTGKRRVDLEIRGELDVPDAVLYWLAAGASFPQDAVFLGTLGGTGVRGFDLPRSATETGDLLLYSLSRGEHVARFRLEG